MANRVVLLGATGYTGRLTLEAMLARGLKPVAAGRSPARLRSVLDDLGVELEAATADATDPGSLRALLSEGDVLVSTVGPFARWGDAVVEAAISARATYLDSNGEPSFTRQVFERHGPSAAAAGLALMTAFGWENVAGNLAAGLALREAGEAAVRVDTGYFYVGRTGFSGGTRASFAEAMLQPSFAWRDAELRTVRGGERTRRFSVQGKRSPALALGASEHIAIPRTFPNVREVNAYLGWFGALGPSVTPLLHRLSALGSPALRSRRVRALAAAALRRATGGSTGGPGPAERRDSEVHVIGAAYDASGVQLAEVHLAGPEGYELTAALLAWGAKRVLAGDATGTGALGPVEAFGLDELAAGCRELGLAPTQAADSAMKR